jgi:hypothetical protein
MSSNHILQTNTLNFMIEVISTLTSIKNNFLPLSLGIEGAAFEENFARIPQRLANRF